MLVSSVMLMVCCLAVGRRLSNVGALACVARTVALTVSACGSVSSYSVEVLCLKGVRLTFRMPRSRGDAERFIGSRRGALVGWISGARNECLRIYS